MNSILEMWRLAEVNPEARSGEYRTLLTNYVAMKHNLSKLETRNAYWLNKGDLNNVDLIWLLLTAAIVSPERFKVSKATAAIIHHRLRNRRNREHLNLDHAVPVSTFKKIARQMKWSRKHEFADFARFVDGHYSYGILTKWEHDQLNRDTWDGPELFERQQTIPMASSTRLRRLWFALMRRALRPGLVGSGSRRLRQRLAQTFEVPVAMER